MRDMQNRRWIYGIVALAAIAVIGTAAGLYLKASSRIDPAMPPPSDSKAQAAPATAPSLDVAADRLAQRLRANDGTSDDWALLARSYVQMQRYPEAVEAFTKALQKRPGDQALIEEQAAARKAAGAK
jgi:cytochrome c-type biogenesis protein CcmH/NrfG